MTKDEALASLAHCRGRIDILDRRLLALLNERTRIVEEIAEAKRAAGLAVQEPAREEEVFRNIAEHNSGPLPEDASRRIFETILREMRVIQRARIETA
jgi:chorismate mutase